MEIPQRRFEVPFAGPRFLCFRPQECGTLGAFDVVVVGGGVAGICAALECARWGSVALVTKAEIEESNTRYAQGGVAAVLGDDDSFDAHVGDTLAVGGDLCHEDVVREIVREGPQAVSRLMEYGGLFDQAGDGLELSREGGHTRGRVVHARGDATGLEIQTVLTSRVRAEPRVKILEGTFAVDLATAEGSVAGVVVLDGRRRAQLLRCRAVILAAGGAGRIYRETTNPEVATGDGVAMAWRAGARLRGLEFFQFHPTTLYVPGVPRLLISETVRGEGAILRDRDGRAFMEGVHELKDLAPRDVVSRAIVRQIIATGDTSVYLDVSPIGEKRFRTRFPGIARVLDEYGIDFAREPIPVHPAAHYMIGGVAADADGRTSIPGLYAVGEVSCTGLHGANRLGSNSLLEGLVCGTRAGRAAASERAATARSLDWGERPDELEPAALDRRDLWNSMRAAMWKRVAIERDESGLRFAAERLERWSGLLFRTRFDDRNGLSLVNAMTVARLVTQAALTREESRGTHFRADFPRADDDHWRCDLFCVREG